MSSGISNVVRVVSRVSAVAAVGVECALLKQDVSGKMKDQDRIRAQVIDGYELYGFHGTHSKFEYMPSSNRLCVTQSDKTAYAYAQKHDDPAIVPVYVKQEASYSKIIGTPYMIGVGDLDFSYKQDIKIDEKGKENPVELVQNNCVELTRSALSETGSFKLGKPEPVHKNKSVINRLFDILRRLC